MSIRSEIARSVGLGSSLIGSGIAFASSPQLNVSACWDVKEPPESPYDQSGLGAALTEGFRCETIGKRRGHSNADGSCGHTPRTSCGSGLWLARLMGIVKEPPEGPYDQSGLGTALTESFRRETIGKRGGHSNGDGSCGLTPWTSSSSFVFHASRPHPATLAPV